MTGGWLAGWVLASTLLLMLSLAVAHRSGLLAELLAPRTALRRRTPGGAPARTAAPESTNLQPVAADLGDSRRLNPPAPAPGYLTRALDDLYSYRPPAPSADRSRARGTVLMADGTLVTGTIVAFYPNGYCTLVADVDGRPSTVDGGGRQIYTRRRDVRMLPSGAERS